MKIKELFESAGENPFKSPTIFKESEVLHAFKQLMREAGVDGHVKWRHDASLQAFSINIHVNESSQRMLEKFWDAVAKCIREALSEPDIRIAIAGRRGMYDSTSASTKASHIKFVQNIGILKVTSLHPDADDVQELFQNELNIIVSYDEVFQR